MTRKQRHYRRLADRRKQRQPQPEPKALGNAVAHPEMTYWLTPAVYSRRCEVCGHKGSVAYRHSDQSSLCEVCVERLGIVPLESKAWKRAGRRAA